jgi:hypothetical protein
MFGRPLPGGRFLCHFFRPGRTGASTIIAAAIFSSSIHQCEQAVETVSRDPKVRCDLFWRGDWRRDLDRVAHVNSIVERSAVGFGFDLGL